MINIFKKRKVQKEDGRCPHCEAIGDLFAIVEFLGWHVCLPEGGGPQDDGHVHGMIIGEEHYVDYVTKHLD